MNDESQKEKLRQHFARRVTTQARVVLDTWQKIRDDRSQAPAHRDDLIAAADKLVRYARRFEMDSHAAAGELILSLLTDWHQDTPWTMPKPRHWKMPPRICAYPPSVAPTRTPPARPSSIVEHQFILPCRTKRWPHD